MIIGEILSVTYFQRQKRFGKKDMHTLYDAQFQRLNTLSIDKLEKLINDKSISDELRDKAREVLRRKLDPQDRDAIEI